MLNCFWVDAPEQAQDQSLRKVNLKPLSQVRWVEREERKEVNWYD